jgi:CRP-like cAMP-binding protein
MKQGDQGDKFYILLEGTVVAEKRDEEDDLPKVVYRYEIGDYFG